MSDTNITEGTRDLLAAISEAMTVPVANYDDRERELQVMRSRAAAVGGVLAAIAEYDVTPEVAARCLRRAVAAEQPLRIASSRVLLTPNEPTSEVPRER